MPRTRPRGRSPQQKSRTVGGLPLGCADAGGVYAGYTLVAGDDFDGPLNVYSAANPAGRYDTTHVYGAGARTVLGALQRSFDTDPYCTGAADSNRGVPLAVSDTMQQARSVLSLKVRPATAAETPHTNKRKILSAMVHSGRYLTVSAPCVIEASVKLDSPAPTGWHPTFWVMNTNPLNSISTGNPGNLEFDFPECYSTGDQANVNVHGTVSGWATDSTNLSGVVRNAFHKYTLVVTAASVLFYRDDALVKTEAHDGTLPGRPYYFLITAHTFDSTFGSDTSVNQAAWAASAGVTIAVDWVRVWTPSANSLPVVTPTQQLPTQQYNYNTSVSYTFPSLTTLYGSAAVAAGLTDYCQAVKVDDFEPGCAVDGASVYDQFPAGLTWNAGTRTLSGQPTEKKPGRLNLVSVPNLTGYAGYSARGYVDVGPNIVPGTIYAVNGAPMAFDLWAACDCGNLSTGKVVTVSNLPSWAAYSAATGLLTGTPTGTGTTALAVGVTNLVGQSATKTVNLTVLTVTGSLAVENAASAAGTSPITMNASTSGTNRLLVLFVGYTANSNPGVYSVTDASGLTWYRRQFRTISTTLNEEVWWAVAPAQLTADAITVTLNAGNVVSAFRYALFAVSGANLGNPWCADASLPYEQDVTSSTSAAGTITTDAANNLVVATIRGAAALGTVTEPSGFTNLVAAGANQDVCYQVNSSSLTGQAVSFSWTNTLSPILMIDAIRGV